ncbi:MAG: low molecular weight protein-tyrosine-phosphatase [Lachnospiraceae bacterium]
MIRVLFICHGNICRSPMAEFVFKDLVAARGLTGQFHIASAATSTEEIWNGIGNPVYPPAREELAKHSISCKGKRAVQVTKQDCEFYDYLVCMDKNNLRNLARIIGTDTEGKVSLLLDYTNRPGASIADPWYTGDFKTTYRDVLEGCEALLGYIMREEDVH